MARWRPTRRARQPFGVPDRPAPGKCDGPGSACSTHAAAPGDRARPRRQRDAADAPAGTTWTRSSRCSSRWIRSGARELVWTPAQDLALRQRRHRVGVIRLVCRPRRSLVRPFPRQAARLADPPVARDGLLDAPAACAIRGSSLLPRRVDGPAEAWVRSTGDDLPRGDRFDRFLHGAASRTADGREESGHRPRVADCISAGARPARVLLARGLLSESVGGGWEGCRIQAKAVHQHSVIETLDAVDRLSRGAGGGGGGVVRAGGSFRGSSSGGGLDRVERAGRDGSVRCGSGVGDAVGVGVRGGRPSWGRGCG